MKHSFVIFRWFHLFFLLHSPLRHSSTQSMYSEKNIIFFNVSMLNMIATISHSQHKQQQHTSIQEKAYNKLCWGFFRWMVLPDCHICVCAKWWFLPSFRSFLQTQLLIFSLSPLLFSFFFSYRRIVVVVVVFRNLSWATHTTTLHTEQKAGKKSIKNKNNKKKKKNKKKVLIALFTFLIIISFNFFSFFFLHYKAESYQFIFDSLFWIAITIASN